MTWRDCIKQKMLWRRGLRRWIISGLNEVMKLKGRVLFSVIACAPWILHWAISNGYGSLVCLVFSMTGMASGTRVVLTYIFEWLNIGVQHATDKPTETGKHLLGLLIRRFLVVWRKNNYVPEKKGTFKTLAFKILEM